MKMAISENRKLVAWVDGDIVFIVRHYFSRYVDYYQKHGYKIFVRM